MELQNREILQEQQAVAHGIGIHSSQDHDVTQQCYLKTFRNFHDNSKCILNMLKFVKKVFLYLVENENIRPKLIKGKTENKVSQFSYKFLFSTNPFLLFQ